MEEIMKIKLETDLEEAIEITKNPNSKCRYMSIYSQIFGVTNENQNEIAKIIDFKDQDILVTGSSGDQYFSSVFYGSKNETIYDINILSEYYIFLKICAMRNLHYNNFIEFILPFINKEKYFDPKTIKSLYQELPEHIKEFWYLYLSEIDVKNIGNLIKCSDKDILDIIHRVPYLDEKNFEKLQKILKQKEYPKFINADAAYFECYIKDNYDFISLSNIIECNQQPFDNITERRLYTNQEWIQYIKEEICKNLNPNGKILIYQTTDWNSEDYEKSGFEKHIVNNSNQKNIALILKR